MKQWPLVASFILFIVLCASVAYWAMQLFKPPLRAVAAPPPSAQAAPNLDAAAGLFGGRSTVAVASNFQLKGVVVSGTPGDSVAILATDGKPAQAVRVNAEVAPGVTVKEVHKQYVLLSDSGVIKKVELPEEAPSDGNVTVSSRSPVPARTAPTAPPRVVVSPPSQTPQAAVPNPGVPQAQPAPANPGTPPAQPTVTVPNVPAQTVNSGNTSVPTNRSAAPAASVGRSSPGYNPAGSQAPPSVPAPSVPAVPAAQSAVQGQAAPLTQPVPQSQSTPGAPAAAQQR